MLLQRRTCCTRGLKWQALPTEHHPVRLLDAADAEAWAERRLCPIDPDRAWVLSPLWSVLEVTLGSTEQWICSLLSNNQLSWPRWENTRPCDSLLIIELMVVVGADWQAISNALEWSTDQLEHILDMQPLQCWGGPDQAVIDNLARAKALSYSILARRAAHELLGECV